MTLGRKGGKAAEVPEVESEATGEAGGDAISLPPDVVADTALASLNIHSGILLLEESITRSSNNLRAHAAAAATAAAPAAGVEMLVFFRCDLFGGEG